MIEVTKVPHKVSRSIYSFSLTKALKHCYNALRKFCDHSGLLPFIHVLFINYTHSIATMKVPLIRSELNFFWIVVIVIVYGLKILGLTPLSVKTKKSSRNFTRVFLFSKIGLAYNIFLTILIPVMVGFEFPHLLSLSYKNESMVTRATDISQGILCVFTVWTIVITWTFKQRKATFIMNEILEIDVKLSGMNKQPFNKMSLIFSITHVMINGSLWVIIWATESVEPVISDAFVNWFFFTIPSFVIYWFIVEYIMVVGLVARKLEIINKNLTNFNEVRNYLSRPSFINDYMTGWSLSTHNQLNALNLIHNIRTALFDLSQEIADFFSFPILACVAYSFFSLVYNVYFLITPVVLKNSEFSLSGSLTAVSWIFISLYPLALLFINVTKTVTEAKLTARLIHKLLSTAIREELKTELEIFSLQLLHENINFTAYGFFTLDFTLLHSMLAATATYLVILIQFQ